MDLVVQNVHHPGREEGHSPDDDHGGDSISGHLVGITMDIMGFISSVAYAKVATVSLNEMRVKSNS